VAAVSRFASTARGRLAVLCETEVLVVDVASQQVMARLANPHKEVLTASTCPRTGQRLVTAVTTARSRAGCGDGGAGCAAQRAAIAPAISAAPRHGAPGGRGWSRALRRRLARRGRNEGTVYVWTSGAGKQLLDHARRGGARRRLAAIGLRRCLAHDHGDRFGMRHIDVSAGASRVVVSAAGRLATGPSPTTGRLRGDHLVDGRRRLSLRTSRSGSSAPQRRPN